MKILYFNNLGVRITAVIFILIFGCISATFLTASFPYKGVNTQINLISDYPISFNTPNNFKFTLQKDIPAINLLNTKKYNSKSGEFSFEYPSCFQLYDNSFEGGEILYHIDMNCIQENIRGFFEVWSLSSSLLDFLNKAEATASKSINNFSRQPITVNGLSGYEWKYEITNDEGRKYYAMEGFLEKDSKMYRISLFVPLEKLSDNSKKIFDTILKSINVNI